MIREAFVRVIGLLERQPMTFSQSRRELEGVDNQKVISAVLGGSVKSGAVIKDHILHYRIRQDSKGYAYLQSTVGDYLSPRHKAAWRRIKDELNARSLNT